MPRIKRKTVGLDPKVPVQALATVIVAALGYFAIDLDPEVALALAVLIGTGAGIAAPAPKVEVTPEPADAASVARDVLS